MDISKVFSEIHEAFNMGNFEEVNESFDYLEDEQIGKMNSLEKTYWTLANLNRHSLQILQQLIWYKFNICNEFLAIVIIKKNFNFYRELLLRSITKRYAQELNDCSEYEWGLRENYIIVKKNKRNSSYWASIVDQLPKQPKKVLVNIVKN